MTEEAATGQYRRQAKSSSTWAERRP
jgi:hypothetical protein